MDAIDEDFLPPDALSAAEFHALPPEQRLRLWRRKLTALREHNRQMAVALEADLAEVEQRLEAEDEGAFCPRVLLLPMGRPLGSDERVVDVAAGALALPALCHAGGELGVTLLPPALSTWAVVRLVDAAIVAVLPTRAAAMAALDRLALYDFSPGSVDQVRDAAVDGLGEGAAHG